MLRTDAGARSTRPRLGGALPIPLPYGQGQRGRAPGLGALGGDDRLQGCGPSLGVRGSMSGAGLGRGASRGGANPPLRPLTPLNGRPARGRDERRAYPDDEDDEPSEVSDREEDTPDWGRMQIDVHLGTEAGRFAGTKAKQDCVVFTARTAALRDFTLSHFRALAQGKADQAEITGYEDSRRAYHMFVLKGNASDRSITDYLDNGHDLRKHVRNMLTDAAGEPPQQQSERDTHIHSCRLRVVLLDDADAKQAQNKKSRPALLNRLVARGVQGVRPDHAGASIEHATRPGGHTAAPWRRSHPR